MDKRLREQALRHAAEKGDAVRVKQMLVEGVNPDAVDDYWKRTPLHLAAENGHHETVSALLTAGADVNVQDALQRTPLHLAAMRGHPETVSALLAAGTDGNVQDYHQITPLHLAAWSGHHETVSALLAAGADVNVQDRVQRTPLHLAAERGHLKTVSALLAAGADVHVNAKGYEGRSLLDLAAEKGHHETVSALLEAGADVNVQSEYWQTLPLYLAAIRGHHETVSALLTAGADVNVQDGQQRTPLHLAAENGQHETVSVLLAAGAHVNAMDNELQRTPLHLAAENGHLEAVTALLAAGADVDAQDTWGQTPLQYARATKQTSVGHLLCIEVLEQQNADKLGKKENYRTIYKMGKTGRKERPRTDDSDLAESKKVISTLQTEADLVQMLATILSQLEETDVRLLMRVWSARTGKQESPDAQGELPADLIRDMMKSEYITAGDLKLLEKDMMAAGVSFPATVQDIPGVPEELKYTRTTEAAVGPTGGEMEIPGFVKLVVPPGVLQEDTTITISTVDVAAILRNLPSMNWISGYPWSLGEDACPRELLDQVLFSPAVDVNLHGAQLNGPVELQTWRPPGSEGMKCILLKHHDEKGWTNITASTEYQLYSHEISLSLQSFSPFVIEWAYGPIERVVSVAKMMVDALSARTLNCRFAAYINPSLEDVRFHVVCRDKEVETDVNEYLPRFTKCGGNKGMFHVFNGDVLDIAVRVRGGHDESKQMEIQSEQCCEKDGQNVQILLDRPNGNRVKGDVDVKKVQVPTNRTVCQFIFKEEGDTLQREDSTTPAPRGATASMAGTKSQQRYDGAGPSPSGTTRATGGTTRATGGTTRATGGTTRATGGTTRATGGTTRATGGTTRATGGTTRATGGTTRATGGTTRATGGTTRATGGTTRATGGTTRATGGTTRATGGTTRATGGTTRATGGTTRATDGSTRATGGTTRATADMDLCFKKVIAKASHKWDDLARELGFNENQIKGIETLKPDQDRRSREMLDRWRNREGSGATLQVLKQALIDIGERLTAESLTS
ncbi:uncharacterized protein LOC144866125 isoform X2 [Branchiostoma floridae x Branchiostoma japonicum]